jgi:hypothetical protein
MNGTVNARVRRVVIGHSERSLIHAVDGDNLEYKIEVPSEVLRNLVPGQELIAHAVLDAPAPRDRHGDLVVDGVATAAPTPRADPAAERGRRGVHGAHGPSARLAGSGQPRNPGSSPPPTE